MRKLSISTKLASTLLMLNIVIISIVAGFTFLKIKQIVINKSKKHINSINNNKANIINNFFDDNINKIKLTKYTSDIRELSLKINELKYSNKFIFIDTTTLSTGVFLEQVFLNNFSNVYLIGKNNKVLYLKKNSDKKNQEYLTQATDINFDDKKIIIQDFTIHNKKHLKILTEIKENNKRIGIIVFEISSQQIDKIILDNKKDYGFEDSGETYLIGKDYLMRSSSRFIKNSMMNTLIKTKSSIDVFNSLNDTKTITDYRGLKVLSSYKMISFLNIKWAVITEIDYQEILIPINRIRDNIISICIIISILVFIIIIFVSRVITKPIIKLNHAVKEISKGNFNINIKNISNDEIGDLTNTFNKMVVQLKIKTCELEKAKHKNMKAILNGQESERQRISRELHDSLGQLLIGMKLKYENTLSKNKIQNIDFDELKELFDKTIDETRRISNNLMPASLLEFGLITAIKHICNEISNSSEININLKTSGSSKSLNAETKTYIFRIIQEGTTNIMKHSKANTANLNLEFTSETINIKISDNGKGFDITKKTKTNGLTNIKNRVSLLSGQIKIQSNKNIGTNIDIMIPVKNKIK